MTDDKQPYDPKNIYDNEARGRPSMPGLFGGPDETVVDGETLEIGPEIRRSASYLSPFRMDHIVELHSTRSDNPTSRTLFPEDWSTEKIFEAVRSIVANPRSRWSREIDSPRGGRPGTLMNPWHDRLDIEWEIPARLRVDGHYEHVEIRVIVEPYGEGIITAYTYSSHR